MPLLARTLLACWLTLVATGTDAAHCHAAAAGHTHGFGWASIGTPAGRALPSSHHHLVLFGIELGAAPDTQDGSPDGPQPALCADAETDTDGESSADQLDLCLPHPLFSFAEGVRLTDTAPGPSLLPLPASARSCILRL